MTVAKPFLSDMNSEQFLKGLNVRGKQQLGVFKKADSFFLPGWPIEGKYKAISYRSSSRLVTSSELLTVGIVMTPTSLPHRSAAFLMSASKQGTYLRMARIFFLVIAGG